MALTVELSTRLECSVEDAWYWVQRPALLDHVAHPMMQFEYSPTIDPDEPWPLGEHRVGLKAFGAIPFSWQVIGIETPEGAGQERLLRDNGYSPLIKRWDHWIVILPTPDGKATSYTDRVHIDAGILTPAVATYARRFYAHRQSRWRSLAASDFAALVSR